LEHVFIVHKKRGYMGGGQQPAHFHIRVSGRCGVDEPHVRHLCALIDGWPCRRERDAGNYCKVPSACTEDHRSMKKIEIVIT